LTLVRYLQLRHFSLKHLLKVNKKESQFKFKNVNYLASLKQVPLSAHLLFLVFFWSIYQLVTFFFDRLWKEWNQNLCLELSCFSAKGYSYFEWVKCNESNPDGDVHPQLAHCWLLKYFMLTVSPYWVMKIVKLHIKCWLCVHRASTTN